MGEMNVFGLDEIEMENTPFDDLESENVNLIFVGIDASGSMEDYAAAMVQCLKDFKTAIHDSQDADEILVARADFHDQKVSIGGYKKIDELDERYRVFGSTPLYDAVVEGGEKLLQYMDLLRRNGMRVKAVFSIFSDGEDNASQKTVAEAVRAIEKMNAMEVVTALIAFGNGALGIGSRLKFKNILQVNSSAAELRKAFHCLSRSVIESSKSVISKTDDFFI